MRASGHVTVSTATAHGVGVKNGVKGGSEAVCYLSVIRRDRRVNPFPSLSYFTVSVL